jgi:hypothetical protein
MVKNHLPIKLFFRRKDTVNDLIYGVERKLMSINFLDHKLKNEKFTFLSEAIDSIEIIERLVQIIIDDETYCFSEEYRQQFYYCFLLSM